MTRNKPFVWSHCILAALILSVPLVGLEVRAETCVASIFIPSPDNVHGETRVLRREDSACVQTILHSASFRRGIKEILSREAQLWPSTKTGYEDSLKYREELEKVKDIIVSDPRAEGDAGRPYTLLMNFIYQPGSSRIEFSRAEVEKGPDTFSIKTNTIFSTLSVSDVYMSRAMLIMTAAAFGPQRNDTMSLLQSAGWSDLSASPDVSAPAPLR